MSQATAFEGSISRSPSCPLSFVLAAAETEGHRRVFLAAHLVGTLEKLKGSQDVKEAWIAIAASIPPSKESSPVGTPPERQFIVTPQPQQVESALKKINQQLSPQQEALAAEHSGNEAYWNFLAQHPGIVPAGDF